MPARGGSRTWTCPTPALEVVAPDTLVVSNVGIGGAAYSFSLQFSLDGSIVGAAQEQGHRVRTAAELQRDDLLSSADADSLVSGFGAGAALPGEGAWSMTAAGTVAQTDAGASHAKFAVADVAQPEVLTLYGLTARVDGGARVGYGLHFLASDTPGFRQHLELRSLLPRVVDPRARLLRHRGDAGAALRVAGRQSAGVAQEP